MDAVLPTHSDNPSGLAPNDHRRIGKELELFAFSDVVGSGLPLYTEKGTTIRRELERFVVDEELKRGYKHVTTPDIAKLDLYRKSGHYPYYKDSMYAPIEIDGEEFMLRPMTCPHHFELYLSRPRSYRELPMRIAELAKLYRYELSGVLTGIERTRSFCLTDGHIICADQKQAALEIEGALDLITFTTKALGLVPGEDFWFRLSLGNRQDEKKYFKDDQAWDEAEQLLRTALVNQKISFVEAPEEAAFYGPKIDIQMRDMRGKEDTAFTVQYDFVMPKRFNLNYTAEDGKERTGVVVHRSSIGSIERIMAFLIEKYEGAFPLWLSPVQIVVLPVSEKFAEGAETIRKILTENDIRTTLDTSSESLGKRLRNAKTSKVPYIIVVGEKEIESGNFVLEGRGDEKVPCNSIYEAAEFLLKKIRTRAL
jgi:threonyl-tRNA synthetase